MVHLRDNFLAIVCYQSCLRVVVRSRSLVWQSLSYLFIWPKFGHGIILCVLHNINVMHVSSDTMCRRFAILAWHVYTSTWPDIGLFLTWSLCMLNIRPGKIPFKDILFYFYIHWILITNCIELNGALFLFVRWHNYSVHRKGSWWNEICVKEVTDLLKAFMS